MKNLTNILIINEERFDSRYKHSHPISITDFVIITKEKTFYYIKNRLTGESLIEYPKEDLSQHLNEISVWNS